MAYNNRKTVLGKMTRSNTEKKIIFDWEELEAYFPTRLKFGIEV